MKGFEGCAQEEGLRLAERFAVREDDEVGRELNRKSGTHVGRPIQPNDLEMEIERVADSLAQRLFCCLKIYVWPRVRSTKNVNSNQIPTTF